MFEIMTFENIMSRMLDRLNDDLDKREGSVIWDALAPAALELEQAYIFLDYILLEGFADTADLEFLVRRCAERGITQKAATKAIVKGVFTPTNIDLTGQRFNLGKLNYAIKEAVTGEAGSWYLECEAYGMQGNQTGNLIPIDYIPGLETCVVSEVSIPGTDEEDVEALRSRYFLSLKTKAFGGNKADYLNNTNAVNGVGASKVIPIWNGAGTVKVLVLDSNYDKASSALVNLVQETLDPTQEASGDGLAPIGHVVTVVAPDETTVNITTTLDFDTGYSWLNLQTAINKAVSDYLLELRKNWADSSSLTVRISQIESALLAITGIVDVTGTKINGNASNLTVVNTSIPVIGTVTSN